jgi:hypothetical protein
MALSGLGLLALSAWVYGFPPPTGGGEHAAVVAPLLAQIDTARKDPANGDHWRRQRMCGPTALYTYLRLHDRPCDLLQICNSVTVDEKRGTSFADLQAAAGRFGVESEIINLPDGDLSAAPLPAIAHLSVPNEGHYLVVLKVTPSEVLVANSILGVVETREVNAFRRAWSGVLMVSKAQLASQASGETWLRVAMCGLGCGIFLTARALWKRLAPSRVVKEVSSGGASGTPALETGASRE